MRIDPVERRIYQHIEYSPLFNPRAHRFGRRREILNGSLASQYRSLLRSLAYGHGLDAGDWMSVTYYLLLQDRVEEALGTFARVEAGSLPTRLQYDYMRAYLELAREMRTGFILDSQTWKAHPHWADDLGATEQDEPVSICRRAEKHRLHPVGPGKQFYEPGNPYSGQQHRSGQYGSAEL